MDESANRGFDRRTVLKAGGMLGVGGALAGCVDGVNPLSEDDNDPAATDRTGVVPAFAQGVGYGNVDALLADTSLRDGINQQIRTLDEQVDSYRGPMTVEEFLDQMQESAGVDPRKIHEILGFWGSGANSGAVVLWTDWPESALTGQMSDYSEETYQGTTLYVPEYGGPGAVLEDGVYAVGSGEAVRSVIDVRDGRAQGMSGRLRQVYDSTQGMTRLAVDVPDLSMEDLTGREASSGSQVEQTANSLLKTVEYASGSFSQQGTSRVMQVSLATPSADDADALGASLTAGRQLALNQLETARSQSTLSEVEKLLYDRIVTFAEETTISQNGSTIQMEYAAPPAEFVRNGPALLLAAGVFINTAGFLQTRAEETGQESSEQVTSRVVPAGSAVGIADSEQEVIQTVKISVARTPGGGDIDLGRMTIQYVSPNGVQTFTRDSSPGFSLSPIKDGDSSFPVLNDDGDMGQISIDLTQSGLEPLEPGESATLTLTTDTGGETQIRLTVPDVIRSRSVALSP